MKYRNEACLGIFKLKNAKLNWKKMQFFSNRDKIVDGEAGVTS